MIPTRLKRNEPMKVANTCCVVTSSTTKRVALGVTLVVAEPYAVTMMLSEKVVTANILDASMFRMLSTASAPTLTDTDSGIIDLKRIDNRAVIIATIANNAALNHSFLNICLRIHCQREIILHSLVL